MVSAGVRVVLDYLPDVPFVWAHSEQSGASHRPVEMACLIMALELHLQYPFDNRACETLKTLNLIYGYNSHTPYSLLFNSLFSKEYIDLIALPIKFKQKQAKDTMQNLSNNIVSFQEGKDFFTIKNYH